MVEIINSEQKLHTDYFMYREFEQFCRNNKGIMDLITLLKKDSQIKLSILEKGIFLFGKLQKDHFFCRPYKEDDYYDIEVVTDMNVSNDFMSQHFSSAKEVVGYVFDNYRHFHENGNLSFSAHVSFLQLTLKGYLKIAALGGPHILHFIKDKYFGFSNK